MSESRSMQPATEKAQSLVSRVVNRQVRSQSAKLGELARDGASTIREIGKELETRQVGSAVVDLAESLAGVTDRIATYLANADGTSLIEDVRAYSRAQPGVATAIAVAGGFAAARILKVSLIKDAK